MKSLRDFIKESIESGKNNIKFFKLNLTEFKDLTDKIIYAAEKDGLFAEKTDYGCKVKISNTSKVSSLVSILSSIIDDNNFEYIDSYIFNTISINGNQYNIYVLETPISITNALQIYK